MPVTIEGKQYVFRKEMAELIEQRTGYKPATSTVTKYIKEGKLPRSARFRIAGRSLYPIDEVEKSIHEKLIVQI